MSFIRRYLIYLRPHSFRVAVSALASLVFILFSTFSIWLSADLVQALFSGGISVPSAPEGGLNLENFTDFLKHHSALLVHSDNPLHSLQHVILFMIAAFFLKNLALYIQLYITTFVEQQITRKMRDEFYSKLLQQDLSFFLVRKSGDLVSAGVNDITTLNAGLAESFSYLIRDPLTALVFIILLLGISWKLTLAAVVIAPLTGLAASVIAASLKRKSKRAQEKLGYVTARLNDALYGMRIIQAYGGQRTEKSSFSQATTDHFHQSLGRERTRRLIGPVNELVGVIVIAGILFLAGGKIMGGQWLAAEDFVRFLVLLFGLLSPLVSLGNVQTNLKAAEGAAQRVFELMEADYEIRETQKPEAVQNFKTSIRFENVSLNYDPQRPSALSKVSLEIRPDEHIALVGRSGSGKSSFLNLLPRFYDPSEGRILLDGIDLREYNIRQLRQLFGIVTQEVVLFHDTVRNNITFHQPDISEENLSAAVKQARAYDFICELPEGYDTNLGDLGERLSGGQRQRISIARALLKDPPILLLDEPTSALDSDVAGEILLTLEEAAKGRTVLMATHQLSSITNANRILLFDQGRIIAEGRHDELYKTNELYRDLCDKQFRR